MVISCCSDQTIVFISTFAQTFKFVIVMMFFKTCTQEQRGGSWSSAREVSSANCHNGTAANYSTNKEEIKYLIF